MAKVDYERAAADYQRGRGMALAAILPLRAAVAPSLEHAAGAPLLDVGAGTGQFARAFAGWFGVRVVALEPAAAMRREAARANPHALVSGVAGRAEALPLSRASCGAAWLSTVIHHVDLAATARELRRVLRDGAPVLIRSAFIGREENVTLVRFFTPARRALEHFPTIEQTCEVLGRAGFAHVSDEDVPQESAPSLAAFAERVRGARHADTLLAALDDDEYATGLERLERAVAEEQEPRPVVDRLTLLVLR
jgi:ubiquinone/menaquinone biosynthesis C-methylase UbiE